MKVDSLTLDERKKEMKETLQEYIGLRFSGVLRRGKHSEDGEACIFEAINAYNGLEWSDNPFSCGMPDIRPINDAFRSDGIRTKQMLMLYDSYSDWRYWPEDRKVAAAKFIALETIRRIISEVVCFPHDRNCRESENLGVAADAAYNAARAARVACAADATCAAARAARAARAAADADAARAADAVYAVDDDLLIRAVDIWVEASNIRRKDDNHG
jgi:hypothetical protein